MKPKKAMVERIATITPIATRNTPFTISLMMPQRMPNTPKAVRIIKPHIANPMCCAICLKFAVAVISSLFLIFLFFMRIHKEDRSLMNVPFVTGDKDLDAKFVAEAKAAGLENLKGHRTVGGMRASIYNAMPVAGVEALVAFMKKFEAENA